MKIRERRKSMNITQADLAERVGMSRAAVAKWEVGIAHPKADLLPKIADVLGCTIDELFGRGAQETENAEESTHN